MSFKVIRWRSFSIRFHPSLPVAFIGMGGLIALLLCVSLTLGSYGMNWREALTLLWAPQQGEITTAVIWDLRLPRFCVGLLVGTLLGLSGALLQGLTRNGLADPSLVGVSQGASICVVALIILWPDLPLHLRPAAGFAGAMAAAVIVLWIAQGKASAASLKFVLVGIGVSATISAATTAMLTYGQINKASAALAWLAGTIHTATWTEAAVLATGLAAALPALVWAIRPLSALRFGPDIATAQGLSLRRDHLALMTLAVSLAALAVSMAGPLGFIGLIAPHFSRYILNAGVGSHLLITGMTGGALVAFADLLGRVALAPVQIPAGLVSAAIGAPVFVVLIMRQSMLKHR